MGSWRKTCLLSVLLLLVVVAYGYSQPPPVEREHFIYYLDNPNYLNLADTLLNRTRRQLIDMLRDSLPYKPAVHLVNTQDRFTKLVGGYFPDWGAAAAAPPRKLIAVKSPDHFNLNKSLRELLAHEYSHLALAERTKLCDPPRWFDEGLAQLVSMEWSWSDNLAMSKAAITGQLIPLREIENLNRFNRGEAHVAYAESYLTVNYLFDEYGPDAVNTFLDQIAACKSVDEALMAATGSDYDGFQAEIQAMLVERFNVVSLLMDTYFLWIGLAIVVVIGFVIQHRRRKKYYRDWEEREKYESTDFDYGDPDDPERLDDEDEPWRR